MEATRWPQTEAQWCLPTSARRGFTIQLWSLNPAPCGSASVQTAAYSPHLEDSVGWILGKKGQRLVSCDLLISRLPPPSNVMPTRTSRRGKARFVALDNRGRPTWPPSQVGVRDPVPGTLQCTLPTRRALGNPNSLRDLTSFRGSLSGHSLLFRELLWARIRLRPLS